MIPIEWTDAEGRLYQSTDFDPDYRPPLPDGAIRGDVRKQEFCRVCHVPKYFYVDEEKTCVQCGKRFVFGAAEQKYWYESLKFHFCSVAIRCPACRRRRRSEKALQEQIAAALAELRANPEDPSVLLEVAESTVRYRQRTGKGDLDRAIAAARKAGRLWPQNCEAVFWEAACHAEAGRGDRAREILAEFITLTKGARRYRKLRQEAGAYLEASSS